MDHDSTTLLELPDCSPGLPTDEITGAFDQVRASSARAVLEVQCSALRHNFQLITQLAGSAKVMAVVKGNAYGLGAREICRTLKHCGAAAFAVDNVAEGIELRRFGIEEPILVIDGDVAENASLAVQYRLMPGVPHEELLTAYDRAAAQQGVEHPIWLTMNVGFNRSGYRRPEAIASFVRRAAGCRHLHIKALYAHLTNSNGCARITESQIDEFRRAVAVAKGILGPALETSLFASHGIVRWAHKFPTDWVRPGILLYGEHVFDGTKVEAEAVEVVNRFRPAIRWRARVTELLDFEREEAVGYGQHHHTRPGQRLATVALGFGRGYPCVGGERQALVGGRRVPLFGDVGMDALQLDVTGHLAVRRGDWATLLGSDGDERISVGELARLSNLSPYQLLSRLGTHRTYITDSFE